MAFRALKLDKWTSLAGTALSGLLVLGTGCGQEAPADEPDDVVAQPYHPLVPGSSWQYAHSDWEETVTLEAATFDGQDAFLMSDSPNPSDSLRSDAIILAQGGRVSRMTKDEYLMGTGGAQTLTSSVTYGVGFTRFNEDWANQEVGYRETPEYERVETPPGETAKAPEARRHTFEVVSLHEDVPTPIGTFDCIAIKRTKDWQADEGGEEAQTKIFWFARGVGKVQERNEETGSTELLRDYEIPGL